MDILGIGLTEIAVIMVVGVIFLGPAKIVEVASKMGYYWRTAQSFLREAADAATIKLDLQDPLPENQSDSYVEEPTDSVKRDASEDESPSAKNVSEEQN